MRPTLEPDPSPDVEPTEEVAHAVFAVAVVGPDSLMEGLGPDDQGMVTLLEGTVASLSRAAGSEDLEAPRPQAVVVGVEGSGLDEGLCRIATLQARGHTVIAAVSGLSPSRSGLVIDLPGLMEHLGLPMVDMDGRHGFDRLRTELILALRTPHSLPAGGEVPPDEAACRAHVHAALTRHTIAPSRAPWVILALLLAIAAVVALSWLGFLG